MNKEIERVRIDKWLWAVRFYKTRQIAIKAVKNSQITLNDQNIKPSANIKVGDLIVIKKGVHQQQVKVLGLLEKRVSATIAVSMYEETLESKKEADKLKELLANQPKIDVDHRKPDKRGVRSHRAFKRGD